MSKLIQPREAVAELSGYDPGNYKVDINLSANENPYDVPGDIKEQILAAAARTAFNRYPDPLALDIRAAISKRYNVDIDMTAVGNGGDELLQALLLAYGGAGRKVIIFEPTFVMYAVLSELTGTECIKSARREDFTLPEGAVEFARTSRADIVFLCSPNNPSGNLITEAEAVSFLETGALVIVDEAYDEFSRSSIRDLLGAYPNLVVLRTFSKAFSLAGLRVGYILAAPEIVANVLKVKLPYNVNAFSQAAASLIMRNHSKFDSVIEEIIGERDRLFDAIGRIDGLTPYPSAANFILVRADEAFGRVSLWRDLIERGILVRHFEKTPGLENCVRITVGTPAENDALIAALRSLYS